MHDTSVAGTARKMIELYGNEAQAEATRRGEKALQRDDNRGFERWAYIASMIGGLHARSAVSDVPLTH